MTRQSTNQAQQRARVSLRRAKARARQRHLDRCKKRDERTVRAEMGRKQVGWWLLKAFRKDKS